MHRYKNWTVERLEDRDLPTAGLVALGTDVGPTASAYLYDPDGTVRFDVRPYGSDFTGGVRVAVGDVNGDGIADLITAPGPGTEPVVRIFSGLDGAEFSSFFAFEPSFTGGVYVAAADLDADGKVEIVVSPDETGGPRVRVLKGPEGSETLADFFAFETSFLGGVRVALGDVDGSGTVDLIVAAGFGGGPRVAVFDGTWLAPGPVEIPRLLPDFFAFEDTLRNGVYVAAGDLTGNGRADLVFGAGPGGGPRVMAWDAEWLLASGGLEQVTLLNFFAHDPTQRSGVPVAVGDLDGDGRGDLLVGSGQGGDGIVKGYLLPTLELARTFPGLGHGSSGAFPSAQAIRVLSDQNPPVNTTEPHSPVSPVTSAPANPTISPTTPPPVSPNPPASPNPPESPNPPASRPPQISSVPDQIVQENGTTGPVAFIVMDEDTPADSLTVTATSSNMILLPESAIILGGIGENRTVTITPATGQTGEAVVTLIVSDPGGLTAATTFSVTVYSPLPGTDSPTGRNPRLVWTRQQQTVWQMMREENHPWWQLVKSNADRTGTSSERYNDYGQWATLVYQITGDAAYAEKAWNKLSSLWIGQLPWGRNGTREYFAELVVLYDWLYPALTQAQRAAFIDTLNLWGDAVLYTTGWGTRSGDSDETVGHYFGLALLDIATGPDNPRAGTFLSQTWFDGYRVKPVGGLDATGVNRETMRNEIAEYMQRAAGGQWIESSDYNLGTLQLLLIGAQGVRTATGVDHFPEVTSYLKQAALALIHELTADLKSAYQWGDLGHARSLNLTKRITLMGMLAGFTQDDSQVGPYANRLVMDLVATYGATGWSSAEPWARLFFFYNPYSPQADWRGLPNSHYNPGTGILHVRDGWDYNNSFFTAHMSTRVNVDHEVQFFGDFQLYRKGEWAITRPLGYWGPAILGESANSMLIAGLSSMSFRGPIAHAAPSDGSWAYIVGTTSGQYYDQPYWDPPPTFLHEWTRSIFYLPSADNKSDTIIVFDRVDADNPMNLPKLDRYRQGDRNAITSAAGLKQWIIHTPVVPTLTNDAIAWTTDGGQQVRVSTLQPLNQTRTIYDEKELWPNPPYWNFQESEKKYQVRIVPTTEQRWDTFLNVVQVSDPGTDLANVGVRSAGGEASGVLVRRGGLADTLVMFGAQQGTRLLSTGYNVTWTAGATSTDLYLMDLDPTKTWSIRVNGGPAVSLTVTPEGIGRVTINGTGQQSLQLIAG
jgi:hypothetical protein